MSQTIKDQGSSEPAIESEAGTTGPASSSKPAGQPAQQSIPIDDARVQVCYANYRRVTGTPEELILDFGLKSQPSGTPTAAIDVNQRLILNYFTAKRRLHTLELLLQRHEQAFGVLETDVQKRVMRLSRKVAQQAVANG